MSLLQLIENQIGTVYSWPRLILKYLFCEPANSLSTLQLSIFYMETVYLTKWRFNYFELATKQRVMNWWNTSIIITKHKNSKDVAHLDIYFNLKIEKHVYINGSQRNQLETVDFLDTDEPKGIVFWKFIYKNHQEENTQNS